MSGTQRGKGFVSPRNPTGVAFAAGLRAKEQADAQKAKERQALAELAANGTTDLAAISDAHGGADVYVDDDGTIVVRYA